MTAATRASIRPRLPLVALAVYVTLDFANPLMPGAVRFLGGEVDVVHGDRVSRADLPAVTADASPAIPAGRPHRSRLAAHHAPARPARRAVRHARRPTGRRGDHAPPSPPDDH